MIRDNIISKLDKNPNGLTVSALLDQLNLKKDPETYCACEALLLLSAEVDCEGQNWKIFKKERKNKIMAAIEAYADSSGKKIFRVSAALSGLPVHEHPTEDELKTILDKSNGRFQLLRNAMIKRIS